MARLIESAGKWLDEHGPWMSWSTRQRSRMHTYLSFGANTGRVGLGGRGERRVRVVRCSVFAATLKLGLRRHRGARCRWFLVPPVVLLVVGTAGAGHYSPPPGDA